MTEYLIPLVLFGTVLLIMFVFIIVSFMVIHKQKQERHRITVKEINTRYESELLRTRLEVQEQALNLISSEIHDNIGQVLTGVHMKLMTLPGRLQESPETSDELTEVASRMGKAIKDLRNLSHILNGTMIEKIGLLEAVNKELSFASSIYGLECNFTYADNIPDLSNEQDMLLFRIIQESITNIFKHAKATTVNIHIDYQNDLFTLYIADNGVGMDLEQYQNSTDKGIGLQNIGERIKLLKGSLDIQSRPGEGTTLVLTCKLEQ